MERRLCIHLPKKAHNSMYTRLNESCWGISEDSWVHTTVYTTGSGVGEWCANKSLLLLIQPSRWSCFASHSWKAEPHRASRVYWSEKSEGGGCSLLCRTAGHNQLSPSHVNTGFAPYCGHLVESNKIKVALCEKENYCLMCTADMPLYCYWNMDIGEKYNSKYFDYTTW